MDTPVNILAIVGSYRKAGIIERAVDEILASAKERGAVTRKITLLDKRLTFAPTAAVVPRLPEKTMGSVSMMMI